jgi:hypothetical protein
LNNYVNKDNTIVRAAIYLEYNGTCFYEGLPLRFKDMHIDHIIPEYLENTDDLKLIVNRLGLPIDFSLNSLYNLVPCNPNVNQVKNKKQYPIEFLSHCIHMRTSTIVKKIKDRILVLSEEHKSDRNLARLYSRLSEFSDKKKLEELYNSLSNEKPFPKKDALNKYYDFYTYEKSLPNVRLAGFIPTYKKQEGSCLITFSNLRLRDCMITLNHKQILERLFTGIHSDVRLNLRNYIIHSELINSEVYYVDLGNTRIPLEKNEIDQLTEIIDDFSNYYLQECKSLYFDLNQNIFEKNDSKQLRLIKITKALWFDLLEFAREFDYGKGNSEWHIFDSGSSFIKLYDKANSEFLAFLIPEIEGSKYFVNYTQDIWILWTDEFFWVNTLEDINNNKVWSPLKVYHWLINEFIPYVIYRKTEITKKGFFKRKLEITDFKENFKISNFVSSLPDLDSDKNILKIIEKLQLFYSTYNDDKYEFENLIKLYNSLCLILNSSDIDEGGLNYIRGKLDIQGAVNREAVLNGINLVKSELNQDQIFSGFKIDLIFRCMIVALRDYRTNLSSIDIEIIKTNLASFIEKKLIKDLRDNF